jgi:hypothetical protein
MAVGWRSVAAGKTSWNSLPEETTEKMKRPMTLTTLPGLEKPVDSTGLQIRIKKDASADPGSGSVGRFLQSFPGRPLRRPTGFCRIFSDR